MSGEMLIFRSSSASGLGKTGRRTGLAAGLVVIILSVAALASPLVLAAGTASVTESGLSQTEPHQA
jgi:hypothetical protein